MNDHQDPLSEAAEAILDPATRLAIQVEVKRSISHEMAKAVNDPERVRPLVKAVVSETLRNLGVDASNPIELQKDFNHLRDWRKTTESIQKRGLLVSIGIITAGGLGLLWVGLKASINGG